MSSKVTKQVTDEIEAVSNFDSLKAQTERLDELVLLTKQKSNESVQNATEIRKIYESIKRNPQRLFVVESLFVARGTPRKYFADLKDVGGFPIPKMNQPPVVSFTALNGIGMDVRASKDFIEINNPLGDEYINLWIYLK